MATRLESLQAKIQKLQQQADALKAEHQRAVVQQIRKLMLENELTIMDIDDPSVWRDRRVKHVAAAPSASAKLPPKYRNPETGQTWSGRARPPAWIKDVKDRTKFLISGQPDPVSPFSGVKAKALSLTTKAKRPVAPKYRDPVSGLTWSGRGKPPAWIAAAKDRSKFLIDASGTASSTDTKTASAKRGATKRTKGAKPATVKSASRKLSSRAAAKQKRTVVAEPAEGLQADGREQSSQSAQQA